MTIVNNQVAAALEECAEAVQGHWLVIGAVYDFGSSRFCVGQGQISKWIEKFSYVTQCCPTLSPPPVG